MFTQAEISQIVKLLRSSKLLSANKLAALLERNAKVAIVKNQTEIVEITVTKD